MSLFPWLARKQQKYNVDVTFILGDLTDSKDRHSAALVNRIVDGLKLLKPRIYLLKGNHDYTDPATPFFGFLNHMEGLRFINYPTIIPNLALIPHCRSQADFDATCEQVPRNAYVMAHNCFEGAIAETGARLSGLSLSALAAKRPRGAWAGDIHKPQSVGGLMTYVGAPYHVRFGDDFTPRVLLVKDGVERNLYFHTVCKWVLNIGDANDLDSEHLHKGDHVKINVNLAREEVYEWPKHKARILAACKSLGLECYGITLKATTGPQRERKAVAGRSRIDVFNAFCTAENLDNVVKKVGQTIMKG